MAMIIKPSSAIIGFGVREGFLALADKLLLRPSRPQRLLDHLLAHVPPGDPAAVISAIDEFARKQRFLMNIGDVKGRILVNQLNISEAGNVLELGTFCGYSAILMGQHLVGRGHIDSLEKDPATAAVARRIIDHAGLSEVITVHEGTAADLIPTLDKVYQLVFIDHWKDQYLPDLLVIEAQGVIAPGTIVVADNVGMFDAGGYLSYVRSCGRYDNTHYDAHMEYSDTIYDAVEVSVVRGDA